MNSTIREVYDNLSAREQSVVKTWKRTLTAESLYDFAIAQGITNPSPDLVYLGTQYGKGWK
jgi:cbb3-type cytochrome oxidase cytochrome c subunit